MRSRIVAAIVVLALALILVGCGGGEDTTATAPEDTGQTQAAAPAAPAVPVADTAPVDKSPTETVTYEPFPQTQPPVAVIDEHIKAKQPMIVFFFDSTQKDTNDQNDAISAVLNDYRGAIDLVSFDVGKYMKTLDDGSIVIDPAFANDPLAQQTAALASAVGVTYTPYIVLTDADGYIVARYRGFVDAKDLEMGVLRATS